MPDSPAGSKTWTRVHNAEGPKTAPKCAEKAQKSRKSAWRQTKVPSSCCPVAAPIGRTYIGRSRADQRCNRQEADTMILNDQPVSRTPQICLKGYELNARQRACEERKTCEGCPFEEPRL